MFLEKIDYGSEVACDKWQVGNRAAMPGTNITLQLQTADSDRLSVLFVVLDLVILFCIVEDLFEYMGIWYTLELTI